LYCIYKVTREPKMKMIRLFTIYIVLLTLYSCNSQKSSETFSNPTKEERKEVNKGKTRYTFSQNAGISMVTTEAEYQLLYDYSQLIDTVFTYSGAYPLGVDSIIYVQLGQTKMPGQDYLIGVINGLRLFDGKQIQKIEIPLFDGYFSSFFVHHYTIYYWGFDKDQLYACSYNLKNKQFSKVPLQKHIGTDDYSVFDVPHLDQDKQVVFKSSVSKKVWTINNKLTRIIRYEDYGIISNQDTTKGKSATDSTKIDR